MEACRNDSDALRRVLDVSRTLALPLDLYDLLDRIVEAGRSILGADRGTVLLYDAERRELYSTVGDEPFRFSVDTGISGAAAARRRTEFVPDCRTDPRFNDAVDRLTGYETRTVLAVPLIGLEDELVGVMTMLNPPENRPWAERDRVLAETLASQAAVAIQRSHLLAERDEKRRLEHEMEVAREIQAGVMPRSLPACAGYDLAATAIPAGHTGGDIFDVIPLDDHRIGLLLADATGHGIGPALMVTQLRAMVRMGLRLESGLVELSAHINRQLMDDLVDCRFITAFLGVLDTTHHEVRYLAPGQGPIVHFHADENRCESFLASSMPLGIDDEPPSLATPIALRSGDVLILLTDGFYEHQNESGEQFGQPRVEAIVGERHRDGAQAIVDGLLAGLEAFSPAPSADDLTAVVLRRH